MSSTGQPGERFAVAKSGWWKGMHPGMTITSLAMVGAFVVFTLVFVESAGNVYSTGRGWVESTFGGLYIIAVCVVFVACLYIMFSRHGRVRLGDDDARPEFSTFSWLAMLFSARLGIGLLFFSISEPMFYFDNAAASGYPNNPHADHAGALDLTEDRAVHAMRITYFHWGMHAWAVYVLVGLCLAYFGFRKKLPLTLRSALHPIIGERIYGPIGHGVDLLAVFGTVFGVATSRGLGVKQMAAGLDVLADVPVNISTYIVLIVIITAVATLSAVFGVARGIRIISEWNIYLSVVLLGFFLVFGRYRIEQDPRLPSTMKKRRGRRRPDPLAGIFDEEIVPMLEQAPDLRTVGIFEELLRPLLELQHVGEHPSSALRREGTSYRSPHIVRRTTARGEPRWTCNTTVSGNSSQRRKGPPCRRTQPRMSHSRSRFDQIAAAVAIAGSTPPFITL